jgi:hypothetical protein
MTGFARDVLGVGKAVKQTARLFLGLTALIGFEASAADLSAQCNGNDGESAPRLHLTLDPFQPPSKLAFYVGAPPLDWPSNPTVIKQDLVFSGGPGDAALRVHKDKGASVRVARARIDNAQNAISLQRTSDAYLYDLTFQKVRPRTIYASVLRIGMKGAKRTLGPTIIQRVFADGEDLPLAAYDQSNTDFLTSGRKNAPVYIRDVTALNFSDAIVDNKATIYISNATFSEAHRILRAHPGAEFIVANAILNSAEGRSLAWLGGKDSAIFYYNTLWNGHPEPDPALIKSREQNLSPGEAAERIIPLAINPLPDLHPVFRHSPTDLRLARSTDGKIWTPLAVDGLTYGPQGLVGDIRITVPKPFEDTQYCLIGTFGAGEPTDVSRWVYDVSTAHLKSVSHE